MRRALTAAFLFCLMAQPRGEAEPPMSEQFRRPVISPYCYLDQNFSMPYWRWAQSQQLEHAQHHMPPRQSQPRRAGRAAPYQPGPGIRPTGHPTYFMMIPGQGGI